jgi:plastocyanin
MRRQLIALALPVIAGALLVLNSRSALAGGGGCHGPDTQGAGTRVALTAMCFSPSILYVQPGDTVTWTNDDAMPHVVAGSFGTWGSPSNLGAGEAMTHLFPTAGIYAYSCPLHYGMNAVVIVGDGKASVPLAVIRPPAATSAAPAPARADSLPVLAIAMAGLAAGFGYAIGRRRTVSPRH